MGALSKNNPDTGTAEALGRDDLPRLFAKARIVVGCSLATTIHADLHGPYTLPIARTAPRRRGCAYGVIVGISARGRAEPVFPVLLWGSGVDRSSLTRWRQRLGEE